MHSTETQGQKRKKESGWRFVEILIFVSDISCERTGEKKNFMMPAIKHTRLGARFIYSTIRDLPRRVFSPPLLTFQAETLVAASAQILSYVCMGKVGVYVLDRILSSVNLPLAKWVAGHRSNRRWCTGVSFFSFFPFNL
jgi:hypothetical protein